MADLNSLIQQMRAEGRYTDLATNPRMQFGTRTRQYLGPQLLPERIVEQNEYREEEIRFRTVIASDNTRYSPPVLKSGDLLGSMLVELGESDIARELTGRMLDTMIALLNRGMDLQSMASLIDWNDVTLVQALLDFNERQRWQAIVDAVVPITITGTTKNVNYLDPAGHRFNAGDSWSDDTYDPFNDIAAGIAVLNAAGYEPRRFITSRAITSILGGNAKVQQRAGRVVMASGDLSVQSRVRADRAAVNAQMDAEGWPNIETYDLQYRTESGTARFLASNVFVIIGASGRDETLDFGDTESLVLEDTLGYVGVGRTVGEPGPGRVVRNWYMDDKPPRLKGQAWQTSLSVIAEPEAIVVIKAID